MMTRNRLLTLALLFLVLVVLAVIFFVGGRERLVEDADLLEEEERAAEGTASVPETRSVILYFLSEEDGFLHPEEREIAAGVSPAAEATRVVEELIKGSQAGLVSTIPPETKVRQVFIMKDGTATVDFSRELAESHPSGSSAEMATVYAVVNTLTANFRSIKRVLFLVDGSERETLGGHISLSRPFLPYRALVAQ